MSEPAGKKIGEATFRGVAEKAMEAGMVLPIHVAALDVRGSCLVLRYVFAGFRGLRYSKVIFEQNVSIPRRWRGPVNIMATDSKGAAARYVIGASGEPELIP